MPTAKWHSSLAGVETRIRRSLGLAGPIGATLEDPMPLQPVIIVDDATRPGGNITTRGRRWMYPTGAEEIDTGLFTAFGLIVDPAAQTTGVNVDRIDITRHSIKDDEVVQLLIYPPGVTLPTWSSGGIVGVNRGPLFVENMQSISDFAPLSWGFFQGVAGVTGGGQVVGNWIQQSGGLQVLNDYKSGTTLQLPFEIFLQPGACIVVQFEPPQADEFHVMVTWYGRVY